MSVAERRTPSRVAPVVNGSLGRGLRRSATQAQPHIRQYMRYAQMRGSLPYPCINRPLHPRRNLRLKPALQAQTKIAIIPTTSMKASSAQGYATSVALATGWRGLARVRSHENYETSLCRACVAAPCCRRLYSFFRCDIRCIYVFDKIYGRKSSGHQDVQSYSLG